MKTCFSKTLSIAIVLLMSIIVIFAAFSPLEAKAVTSGAGTVKVELKNGGNRDFKWPVPGWYGMSGCFLDNRSHYGIDIPANQGTTLVADYEGVVFSTYSGCTHNYAKKSSSEYCGCGGGLGNYIVLEHTYILRDGTTIKLYSRYSHLTSISVSKGAVVKSGGKIGTVGSTGNSQGFHLHYQIMLASTGDKTKISIDPYINNLLELPSGIYLACSSSCAGVGPSGCCCKLYLDQVKQIYSVPLCKHTQYDATGVCENCGKAFDWNSTKKTASGSYAILDNTSPAAAPYEANSTSVVLSAGVPVEVIAQYTNAFGETWYEVSYNNGTKTGFVPGSSVQLVCSESYITSVSVTANKLAKIWSVPCSVDTISSVYAVACAMEGETLYPSRIALNVDGEYWYEVESASGERGWIPCDDVDFVAGGVEDNSIIIGYDFPETIIAKGRHIVYAVKTENATIKSVTGAIYNGTATSGTAVSTKTISGINSQYYDLCNSAIDYALTFGSLTAGKQYTLVIKTELEYKYYENSTICTGTQTVYKAWTFKAISSNSNVLTIQHNVNGGEIATNDEYYVSSSLVYSKSDSKAVERKWAYGNQEKDSLYDGATFKLYRDGYKFLGWSLDPSGTGQIFDQTRLVTVEEIYPEVLNGSKTITLYAIWEKEECNHIYYNSCDTICDECGEERTTLGHVYSYTCDTTCEVCGDVRSNVTHAYGDFYFVDDQYHRQDCADCASYRVYTHTLVNSCDDYCEDCGYTREVAHTYDNACDNACNICGETRATSHEYDNACDNTCDICGESRETSHEYDNACDNACNVCGNTRIVFHNLTSIEYSPEGHWWICAECGFVTDIGEHLFGEFVTKEPTCTETGEKHTMCATCGYDIIAEIPPIDHNYGEPVVITPATCTESGVEAKTCVNCGNVISKAVSPIGHNYGDFAIVKKPTCAEAGRKEKTCANCGNVISESISITDDHAFGDWEEVEIDEDGNVTEKRVCKHCDEYEIRVTENQNHPKTLIEIIIDFFASIFEWFFGLFGGAEE